jgi:D-arabinonate dehydratase
MKIIDVRVTDPYYVPCNPQGDAITTIPPLLAITFCEVLTDEGVIGRVPANGGGVLRALIEEQLKPYVVSEDPMDSERIWSRMYRSSLATGRRGATVIAIGIVDNAIWDLKGRITNQPLHKLLGGFQSSVNSYGSGINLNLDDDALIAQMRGYVDLGFRMVKMEVGHRDAHVDMQRVRRVREAIGPDVALAVDANNSWSLTRAIEMARKLEEFDLYWLEEPMLADEVDGLAILARETSIPIAVGENHYTKWEFKDLLQKQAVEIVQADVTKCGGVTEFMKIAAMADAFGLAVCPHVSSFVDVPCVAAIPNGLFHEYVEGIVEPASRLLVESAVPVRGRITPLDRPGFGIELRPDAAEKYAAKPEGTTGRTTTRGWRWGPYF